MLPIILEPIKSNTNPREEDSQENNEKLNVAVVASIAEDYGFLLSEELIEDVIEIE